MEKCTLYAFWEYDKFPFVLGAPIHKVEPNGRVNPPSYDGYSFTPIMVTSFENGAAIHEKLKKLEVERCIKLEQVHQTFNEKLKETCKGTPMSHLMFHL